MARPQRTRWNAFPALVAPALLVAAFLPGIAAAQGTVVEERHEVETRQMVQPTPSPSTERTTVETHEKRTTVESAPNPGHVTEKKTVETYEED